MTRVNTTWLAICTPRCHDGEPYSTAMPDRQCHLQSFGQGGPNAASGEDVSAACLGFFLVRALCSKRCVGIYAAPSLSERLAAPASLIIKHMQLLAVVVSIVNHEISDPSRATWCFSVLYRYMSVI